jgi:hypothetical protein
MSPWWKGSPIAVENPFLIQTSPAMVPGFRVNQYPLVRVIPGLSASRK